MINNFVNDFRLKNQFLINKYRELDNFVFRKTWVKLDEAKHDI